MDLTVQLRYAPLPSLLRRIAVHHWFVVQGAGQCTRWEVWQDRDAGGTSWGYLYRDLMHPDRGVGGGPAVVAAEWRGETARAVRAVLEEPPRYPHRERYLAWPGPNSNTYAAWVLEQAGVRHGLDPRAIGKDYLGDRGAGWELSRARLRCESPLVGLRVEAGCLELHLLCLTFGLDLREREVRTPVGSVRRKTVRR